MTRKLVILLVIAILVTSCDNNKYPTSPSNNSNSSQSNNTNGNTNNNTIVVIITLPPNVTPTPGNGSPDGSSGNRTPDPSSGILPLPTYGEQVVRAVDTASPQLILNSCQDTLGEAAWGFMDSVVANLRRVDTRWGYVCSAGFTNCAQPSQDKISYHATAGGERDGVTGIYIIDIIVAHCENPRVGYQNLGFDPAGKWSSRGRF